MREVVDLDTAREEVNVVGIRQPGTVHAHAAGKDNVRRAQHRAILLTQRCRRTLKSGQFVHDVIDKQIGLQRRYKRRCHRRVQPQDAIRAALLFKKLCQQVFVGALRLGIAVADPAVFTVPAA